MLADAASASSSLSELDLLRAVVRDIGAPLMIARTSLHPEGRAIIFTNAAFQRMVGRTEEELFGQLPELLVAGDRAAFERIAASVLSGASFSGEIAIARKDGTSFVDEYAAHPIRDGSGRIVYVASVHEDVTARRIAEQRRVELEESMRRTEKMAALGAVAAGVAHQVRNRLFGITATFDAFEARFGERTEFPAFLSVIREDLNRLTALMRDLMEYGSPAPITLARGTLSAVLADAVAGVRGAADAARVAMNASLAIADDAVAMDGARLAHAFMKLIENAIARSVAGATVDVAVARQGETIVVSVRDRGKQVREEDLSRMFEPFHRDRATGLGLAIAHRIVEAHGGVARAHNIDGGVEIAVSLPARGAL
jgi:PAS domain S-box-containing protein